jgi:hypothetical protein
VPPNTYTGHHLVDRAKESQMLAEIFGVDGVIVLIVVVVLLFGGAAIPKLARNLGSAKNEFEKGLDSGKKHSAATAVPVTGTPVVPVTPVNFVTPLAPVTAPVADHANPRS